LEEAICSSINDHSMDLATTRNLADRPVGVRDKDAYAEEPCNLKGLCTVLKGGGRSRLRLPPHHIAKCFDRLDHTVWLSRLPQQVRDERFIHLLSHRVEAGYLAGNATSRDSDDAPQEGESHKEIIERPILSNCRLSPRRI
jgi:hypothetical protein